MWINALVKTTNCHLTCAKGRVSTTYLVRGPEENTKKTFTIDLKIAIINMFHLINHFLLSYYSKSFLMIFPHPNEASNSAHWKKKRVAIKVKKEGRRESEICNCSWVTLKPRSYLTLSMHAPTFENNILICICNWTLQSTEPLALNSLLVRFSS